MIARRRPSLSFHALRWPQLGPAQRVIASLALAVLCLLAPNTAHAQDAPTSPDVVGSISGRVVDEAGEPLAGIQVTGQSEGGQSYASVVTDAEGNYRLNNLVTGLYRLQFQDYRQRYASEFYNNVQVYDEAELVPVSANNVTGIDATLTRSGRISGTVVLTGSLSTLDPDIGISLAANYAFYKEQDGKLEPVYASQMFVYGGPLDSGNRYSYRLDGLAPGIYRLCVGASVYANNSHSLYESQTYTECYDDALLLDEAANVEVIAGDTTSGIDVTLGDNSNYAVLSGQVVGVGEEPLAGISVELVQEVEVDPGLPIPSIFSFVQTDAQGNYEFDALLPGTYRLSFIDYRQIAIGDALTVRYLAESYNNRPYLESPTPIKVEKRQSLKVDAQLAASGAIIGRIELGNSLNNYLSINLIKEGGGESFYVPTQSELEENGAALRYRLDNIPPGRYYLQAMGQLFTRFYPNALTQEDATLVTVEAGVVTPNVDFPDISQGPESGAITGRATVSNGDPAANVPVGLYGALFSADYFDLLALTTTDRDGRYRLPTPQAGVYRVCFALEMGLDSLQLPEYQSGCYNGDNITVPTSTEARDIAVDANETVEGIDLRVQRRTQIHGRVQTEDGLPLEYGNLTLYRRVNENEPNNNGWVVANSFYLDTYGDAPMQYGFNVEPGTYRLQLDGYGPYGNQTLFYPAAQTIGEATDITLVNGEQRNIDFILPDLADASLSGKVMREGEPLAGIRVEIYRSLDFYGEPQPLIYTTTDAKGRYEIRGLFANAYSVRFIDPAGELTTRWYGGGFSLNSATPIGLADGEARTTVDVEMGQFVFNYLPVVGR